MPLAYLLQQLPVDFLRIMTAVVLAWEGWGSLWYIPCVMPLLTRWYSYFSPILHGPFRLIGVVGFIGLHCGFGFALRLGSFFWVSGMMGHYALSQTRHHDANSCHSIGAAAGVVLGLLAALAVCHHSDVGLGKAWGACTHCPVGERAAVPSFAVRPRLATWPEAQATHVLVASI